MSGSDNVLRPSSRVDLVQRTMDTASNFGDRTSGKASAARAESAAKKKAGGQAKKVDRYCDKDLGEPYDNEVKNTSPNATNISHG